jgi:hypothetical protein
MGPPFIVTRIELNGDNSDACGPEPDFEDDTAILLQLEQLRRVVNVDAGRADGMVEPRAHSGPVGIDAPYALRTNDPLGVCVGIDENGIDVLR